MENPLISIIIPAYNAVKYIEETVNSCLNQTYQNLEIIIQDDCSIDGTWELINRLYSSNSKVKLFKNQKNLGIGDNWNAAYDKINGNYTIIFNADDILSPHLIDEFLNIFNSYPSLGVVTGKFEILYSETGKTVLYPDHVNLKGGIVENLFEKLYFKSAFHWNFSLIKTSILEKIKLPNGKLFVNTQVCDYELWYRSFIYGVKVYYDDCKIWGYYRKHETNNSSNPNGELKSFLKDFLQIHQQSYKKLGGHSYVITLIRNLVTFCNFTKRGNSFEIKVLFLYLKRIAQAIF